jgi:hypothetical protein
MGPHALQRGRTGWPHLCIQLPGESRERAGHTSVTSYMEKAASGLATPLYLATWKKPRAVWPHFFDQLPEEKVIGLDTPLWPATWRRLLVFYLEESRIWAGNTSVTSYLEKLLIGWPAIWRKPPAGRTHLWDQLPPGHSGRTTLASEKAKCASAALWKCSVQSSRLHQLARKLFFKLVYWRYTWPILINSYDVFEALIIMSWNLYLIKLILLSNTRATVLLAVINVALANLWEPACWGTIFKQMYALVKIDGLGIISFCTVLSYTNVLLRNDQRFFFATSF